jgi:hypothetical protein
MAARHHISCLSQTALRPDQDFADRLGQDPKASADLVDETYQYSRSLHSHLLSNQAHTSGGELAGWATDTVSDGALVNTETTALRALALGLSGADGSFEPGNPPLATPQGAPFFVRSSAVLSAVAGVSTPSLMSYGRHVSMPSSRYGVTFNLRIPDVPKSPARIAYVDVNDATANRIIATRRLSSSDFRSRNEFTKIRLEFRNANPADRLEFCTYRFCPVNTDAGTIQVSEIRP